MATAQLESLLAGFKLIPTTAVVTSVPTPIVRPVPIAPPVILPKAAAAPAPVAPAGRQMTTKQGTFTTTLSDLEAIEVLESSGEIHRNSFAAKMVSQFRAYNGLFPQKLAWLHKLAIDVLARELGEPSPASPIPAALATDLRPIIAMFGHAIGASLKQPRMTFRDVPGVGTILLAFTTRGKDPGTVNVSDGGPVGRSRYYGRVCKDGTFTAAGRATPAVIEFLSALAADPQGTAGGYGRRSGTCCFCNSALTDPASVAVGYGPVCAKHFGLPHGRPAVKAS